MADGEIMEMLSAGKEAMPHAMIAQAREREPGMEDMRTGTAEMPATDLRAASEEMSGHRLATAAMRR